MACRPHGDGHPRATDGEWPPNLTRIPPARHQWPASHTSNASVHVPPQHVAGGNAGQAQIPPPCFVAAKSVSYCDFELALIAAFGQKHCELHASPSQTVTQSVLALHDVT